MAKPGYTGLKRVIKAAGFSLQGLISTWRYESAFRQELSLCLLLLPAALWLGQTGLERALLVAVLLLVLIVELLNSAIESVVDRQGHEHNELAGRAKDQGSAAVLISLLLVAVSWGLIGWERFA
ncbi:diacylglycerol kinase [Magnetovirga frankeli]|uniref:diacylglycerol kinase n=1 Tax=Magnetovirga frankeli TaxID=947516 RepID=UPI00129376C4|nr:diacylglycerol kinase [gamma proteobacterium SS-5]